jgi:hypothetical protein
VAGEAGRIVPGGGDTFADDDADGLAGKTLGGRHPSMAIDAPEDGVVGQFECGR